MLVPQCAVVPMLILTGLPLRNQVRPQIWQELVRLGHITASTWADLTYILQRSVTLTLEDFASRDTLGHSQHSESIWTPDGPHLKGHEDCVE